MNIFRFKKIFYSLIDKKDIVILLKLVNELYKKNILNEELILNLIKAFVIIFYIDKNNYQIYYNLFEYFNLNKKFSNKLFKILKKIDFSIQINISQKVIDKIIIITNYYIINIKKENYEKHLSLLYDILFLVVNINASINFKINLYLYLIKYSIKNIKNNVEIKKEIDQIKQMLKQVLES